MEHPELVLALIAVAGGAWAVVIERRRERDAQLDASQVRERIAVLETKVEAINDLLDAPDDEREPEPPKYDSPRRGPSKPPTGKRQR